MNIILLLTISLTFGSDEKESSLGQDDNIDQSNGRIDNLDQTESQNIDSDSENSHQPDVQLNEEPDDSEVNSILYIVNIWMNGLVSVGNL